MSSELSWSRTRALALALLAAVPLGCAGGSGGGGSVYGANFPSQQDVERIEKAPAPAAVFDSDLRQVREWVLEAEVPDRIDSRRWVGRTPWGELLAEQAGATGGRAVPTQAMHCVASEFARFALNQGGRPDHSVHSFIIAGCRAPVANVSLRSLSAPVDASVEDDAIFEHWREELLPMLRSELEAAGRSVVGIGFARHGDQAAVYVASGRPLAELEPVATRLGRNRRFELKGRVLGPAQGITAAINRGHYGVVYCPAVGRPKAPAFHFACELDPADDSAWVSLSYTPPGRVLGKRALTALVWREGANDRVYRRVEYTGERTIPDAAHFAPYFLDELNGVRSQAGLGRVSLDVAQSATATLVAPHFFGAMVQDGNEQLADRAALGLLAGWDVEGDIRAGGFTFGAVPDTNDLAVLLSATLEDPLARTTLLDPEIDRLAVGPIVGEAEDVPVLAAVVMGYSLFDASTRDADAEVLFGRLARERHRRELQAPVRLINVWMDAMNAADEVGRGETPNQALDDVLQTSSRTLMRPVRGWYGETSALEDFEFPDELVNTSRLGAAIGVAHRKGPEDAWGRYVVVIVSIAH